MTTLLVANNGGHIMELRALADRFDLAGDRVWVTVPTPQTESLLRDEAVFWVREAPTRDWRAAAANARLIHGAMRRYDVACAISTGSSLALSALPQMAARGIPAHYVESVTRTDGFSLSGRVLRRTPGVALYCQWPHLADSSWRFHGSVLDGFTAERQDARRVRRVVVSVGTSARYGFRRLVERLVKILPEDAEVLWQTGSTDVSGLGIDGRAAIPAVELEQAIADADVVVAHAGAGIALTALRAGKVPVMVPRRAAHHEHVDDHQQQIATVLGARGLAVVADASTLDLADLEAAASARCVIDAAPPTFELQQVDTLLTRRRARRRARRIA